MGRKKLNRTEEEWNELNRKYRMRSYWKHAVRERSEKPENDTIKTSGIYKIINKFNGKYYVGSSVDIARRWRKHREALRRNQHRNRYLQRAWNKDGSNSFDFIVVELISQKELEATEQQYLNLAKKERDKTYNLSFIADRIEMTPEVKTILRDLALIRYKDKHNHPMYGKHLTNKTKEILKIKCANHGRKNGKI